MQSGRIQGNNSNTLVNSIILDCSLESNRLLLLTLLELLTVLVFLLCPPFNAGHHNQNMQGPFFLVSVVADKNWLIFVGVVLFSFFFFLATSGVTSGSDWGVIWGARARIQVSCIIGKYLIHYTIFLAQDLLLNCTVVDPIFTFWRHYFILYKIVQLFVFGPYLLVFGGSFQLYA